MLSSNVVLCGGPPQVIEMARHSPPVRSSYRLERNSRDSLAKWLGGNLILVLIHHVSGSLRAENIDCDIIGLKDVDECVHLCNMLCRAIFEPAQRYFFCVRLG